MDNAATVEPKIQDANLAFIGGVALTRGFLWEWMQMHDGTKVNGHY